MNLVVFGLGFSAAAFVARHGENFSQVTASVRSADKAVRMQRMTGARLELFVGAPVAASLLEAIATAHVILVSVPPGDAGDPVLAALAAEISAAPGLARIVYLSTIGVYGDHDGAWIDEETPARPVAGRSHARLAAEEGWAALAKAANVPLDILRLSGIYGPGRNQLAGLKAGTAKRLIKPGQVFNRIHVDDIADAIWACVEKERPGAIYNVTDDEPAPPQDVVAFAAQLLEVPPPPEQDFFTAELTPMARSFYGENKRVSNARIKRELGFAFNHPTYRDGLRALLEAGEGR